MKTSKWIGLLLAMAVFLTAMITIAANPWKARLRIINQTGKEIYLVLADQETGTITYNLRIPGEAELLPTPTANPDLKPDPGETPTVTPTPYTRDSWLENNTTLFTIERKVYYARLVACGVVMDGTIDLTTNLKLNITPCWAMLDPDSPKYHGEPTMEKPNWFEATGMANWRFVYQLPKVDVESYPGELNLLPLFDPK